MPVAATIKRIMTEPIMLEVVCPSCGAAMAADDDACAACGAELSAVAPVTARKKKSFVDAKWFIISMMVFAALFLGFPLLWRSKAFSLGEKIFWTVVVLLESILAFGAVGWALWRCWQVIREVM